MKHDLTIMIAAGMIYYGLWLGFSSVIKALEGIANVLDDIDNQLRRNTP